jgi:penicillin-binding protein 2
MSIERFQDYARERLLVTRRLQVMLVLVLLSFIVLAGRLFYLQVMTHDVHVARSESNRISLQPLPPNRGLIFDRQGRILADNRPDHQLTIVPERVSDLPQTLNQLQSLMGLSDADIEQFHQQLRRPRRPYSPVVLKQGLTESEMAKVAVHQYFLPGVQLEATLIRHYPHGESFAHALGYVGRINAAERRAIDTRRYIDTDFIGKTGVERFYEDVLMGHPGNQRVEINARGQLLRVLEQTLPTPGTDIQLYLDIDLQQTTYEAMAGRRGAAVAIDIKTGGIVALVSTPSFDPNQFITGFASGEFQALQSDTQLPFLNRAARGQYPPASTIKPFLGFAALQAGTVSWQDRIADPGFFQLPNDDRIFHDWTWRIRPEGRGARIGMAQAIQESSNTFFYHLAYNTRLEPLHDMMHEFGLGQLTALDVHNAALGINPSRQWKRETQGLGWFAGDTVNLGVGQGFLLVTPLQMAIATAVMARQGEWFVPRLLKDTAHEAALAHVSSPRDAIQLNDLSHWQLMEEALLGVVHGPRGTARPLAEGIDYQIIGKTGTAQVFSISNFEDHDADDVAERMRDHAWFIGYAPRHDPQIAVAVLVENGTSGGRVAAPIARIMFDEYLRLPAMANMELQP